MAAPKKGDLSAAEREILQVIAAGKFLFIFLADFVNTFLLFSFVQCCYSNVFICHTNITCCITFLYYF